MIDKTDEFWASAVADDIDEYLKAYSDDPALDVKPIACGCGGDVFIIKYGANRTAVKIMCESCGDERFIADGAAHRGSGSYEELECPMCKSRLHNARVGFRRRRSGSVKWLYIGVRCTQCKALSSPLDWKVDREAAEETERNI
ncbi:MAG: hypothetical protein NC299_13790 [Lachnospiraceae bacterium]|nr:hypothetical protein [Ruminococcus sp.]MCM1276407.1 hypothetical protein [Lachnospiraceae bacterium]